MKHHSGAASKEKGIYFIECNAEHALRNFHKERKENFQRQIVAHERQSDVNARRKITKTTRRPRRIATGDIL